MNLTRDNVKVLCDDIIASGGDRTDIEFAMFAAFNVVIGHGGEGPWPGWPECVYCGAHGGGGHGGLCPSGG